MEEDSIKDLFKSYDPELSSDSRFMNRLKRNLDSVEIVRRHNAGLAKRRKAAVAMAACAGFVAGLVTTLALPCIGRLLMSLPALLPGEPMVQALADNCRIVAWMVVGASMVVTSLNAYDLGLTMASRGRR